MRSLAFIKVMDTSGKLHMIRPESITRFSPDSKVVTHEVTVIHFIDEGSICVRGSAEEVFKELEMYS